MFTVVDHNTPTRAFYKFHLLATLVLMEPLNVKGNKSKWLHRELNKIKLYFVYFLLYFIYRFSSLFCYYQPERIISPYTAIVRRSGNPFELSHVLVSWLIGAGYDAYVVVGCAKRDVCMAIRYRTVCPEIPDETEVTLQRLRKIKCSKIISLPFII